MARENIPIRLLDMLKEKKLINTAQLKKFFSMHKKKDGSIGRALVEENIISPKDLMVFLSEQFGVPPIDLSKYRIEPAIAKLIPEEFAQKYSLLPISKLGDTVTIAMSDPTDILAIDDVRTILKDCKIDVVIASQSDMKDA